MSMIKLAYDIAKKAHEGQKDKGGEDYFNHPYYVATLVTGEDEVVVAILHDVIEDTSVTLNYLKEQGFSPDIISAIDAISKRENESYDDYFNRLCKNKLAVSVKIADMVHNMDIKRIPNPQQEDYARVEKYKEKIKYLINVRDTHFC